MMSVDEHMQSRVIFGCFPDHVGKHFDNYHRPLSRLGTVINPQRFLTGHNRHCVLSLILTFHFTAQETMSGARLCTSDS
jgi:hypothetical protein